MSLITVACWKSNKNSHAPQPGDYILLPHNQTVQIRSTKMLAISVFLAFGKNGKTYIVYSNDSQLVRKHGKIAVANGPIELGKVARITVFSYSANGIERTPHTTGNVKYLSHITKGVIKIATVTKESFYVIS